MQLIPILIDENVAREYKPRAQNKISASQWHPCDRNLWLKRRSAMSETLDGRVIRLMDFGHQMEPVFIGWLQSIGCKVAMCEAQLQNGHIDGVIKLPSGEIMLLEMKTANDKRFNEIKKHGIQKATVGYYYQAQLYMEQSDVLSKVGNKLEQCLFFVMNKNTHELYTEIVERNEMYAFEFLQRIHAADDDEIPDKNVADYQCNMCDFKQMCDKNALPALSCGTCAHWSAREKCDFGTEVCERHVFSPSIMSLCGYDYTDVNHDFGYIEYDQFINGPAVAKDHNKTDKPVLTSAEIIALGRDPDANILELIKRFDGRMVL